MTDCLFCRIVKGEIPAKKVYEDEHSLAFEDIDPQAPTHVLVVSKKHVRGLKEAQKEDAELIGRLHLVAAEIGRQRGIELVEGHAMPDHIHLCLSIPPKYSIAHTIGFLKGKSAVRIHRELLQERRLTGLHFWATGYCVSTVGLDEARVRQYIREQEQAERRQGELNFE